MLVNKKIFILISLACCLTCALIKAETLSYENTDISSDNLSEIPELIDCIVATVNDDIITFRNINLELIIEGKVEKNDVNIEEIIDRIIEDMLIYQELSNYPPTFLTDKKTTVDEEMTSFIKLYGGENAYKQLIYKYGLNPEAVSFNLRRKKIIFLYLNYKLYASVFNSMEELREYYVDQMNGTLDNSTEDFYHRFNEIKEKLTAQKS